MYKPKRGGGNFVSPKGIATIKKLKGNKLGVHFSPANENEFADKKYKVEMLDDYNLDLLLSNEFYIQLSGKKIFSIRPAFGMVEFMCVGLAKKEGEKPKPKLYSYTYNNEKKDYYGFTMKFQIISGKFEGMIVPYFLRYYFEEDEETGNVQYSHWKGTSAVYAPQLDEALTITGVWNYGPIKYADNILPKIEKRILKAKKKFSGVIKNGWIDTLYKDPAINTNDDLPFEPDNDDDDDWEEVDDDDWKGNDEFEFDD